MIEVIKFFDIFSYFYLLPYKSKCEVAKIGAMKGAKLVLCGMKCTDSRLNTVKILGIHFLYNKKIEKDENFLKQITSIEKVLKLWRMRNVTLERKTTVLKALPMSKTIHLALITNIPTSTMNESSKIEK